jgi:hypothetical protein
VSVSRVISPQAPKHPFMAHCSCLVSFVKVVSLLCLSTSPCGSRIATAALSISILSTMLLCMLLSLPFHLLLRRLFASFLIQFISSLLNFDPAYMFPRHNNQPHKSLYHIHFQTFRRSLELMGVCCIGDCLRGRLTVFVC